MLERSKWQKELTVFSRLVNTIVLTGNINDQHPIINEREQRIQGFCSLEIYLAKMCQNQGYQGVVFFDPVQGFHTIPGLQQNCDVVSLVEQTVNSINSSEKNPQGNTLRLTRRKVGNAVSLIPGQLEDAARITHELLTASAASVAVILSFSSRMTARPDDLDTAERMTFMYLQEGAEHAAKFHAGNPSSAEYQTAHMIQNLLFLIADKINDLPAWYYLSHPGLKNIDITKPDYRMRGQIISGYAANFRSYKTASEEERKRFLDTFVGASDGFTTQDIARVFQIAGYGSMDIHNIGKSILLYKYGVQENPWLRLDSSRLATAEQQIRRRVLGQDPVIKAAVDIVKRAAMGMSGLQHSSASSKPRGILFLAGPTGTGKTELAKALTELIFMDERNMLRFDMSEYRQEQSDQRLLGAPPGYVGYEAGGQLTNAVREHPFSVLLFDEIEKAHPSVLDKFLQVLEDGRITDGRGETVYFQDCLIIFTSNLGMTVPSPENPAVRIPNVIYAEDTQYTVVREKILKAIHHFFNEEIGRPELLNRIGNNVLVFDFIREDSLRPILAKQLGNIAQNLLAEKHIRLTITPKAEETLFRMAAADLPKGQGGRGVGNLIEEMLINPLARFMFDNSVKDSASITVDEIARINGVAEIKARLA